MPLTDTISVTQLARETTAVISHLTEDKKRRFVVMRNNRAVALLSGLDASGERGGLPEARPLKDEVFRVVDVIRAIAKANGARSIHLFDRPVDVVTLDSLKPGLWPEVLRDAIPVV